MSKDTLILYEVDGRDKYGEIIGGRFLAEDENHAREQFFDENAEEAKTLEITDIRPIGRYFFNGQDWKPVKSKGQEMKELERCPYCDEKNTECLGDANARGDDYLVEKWRCFDCEKDWNETYKRTGEVEYLD